ncbi:putative RNA-directed DNA polymerase, eukaryota, reverse transcriptase zinc-binding domain protein [Tanacetum coccineum]
MEGSASNEDRDSQLKLLHEIDKLDNFEAMDNIQKSRIKWDVEGNENSKFVHCLINQKCRSNSIKAIMHEGVWITEHLLVKEVFLNYFKQKFQANDSLIDFPSTTTSSRLSDCDRALVEANVSMDEVKVAVWDCGNDKVPGPDGYTFAFIKRYWDILKNDILYFVNLFLSSRKMPLGSNSSFITLIPKVSNPINVNDYQPISLIGVHYKIIAKVLANRLSKVVDKIISHEQSTFIKSRQILDRSLILSEAINWSWIKACLESSWTSILINGSPTSEFNVRRGLRQGDPLSPFLFLIIMEGLHVALTNSVHNGLIRSINIGTSDINLSHLFFADDVIITTDWSTHDLDNIIRIFQVFFLASGLKFNIQKSSICGIGVSTNDIQIMAANTRCSASSFPFTYLGLPIGSNMSLVVNWKPLVDKFHSKLSSWKANLFSYGGRLTFIKAVLGSLGIYFLSLFIAPAMVLKSLEKARGLAIGSLNSFNLALLHKLRWRFFSSPDSLWVKVIKALHGSECGFDLIGCKFNGIWSKIVGTSNYLHSNSILPMDSICFQVGYGYLIRFWKDIWLGDSPLYTRFNRLYQLEQKKNFLVVDRLSNGLWS